MALYSVYFALNLSPGDEVICTAFSYHATAAPLLHFGVKIVFCDVESDTGNIDARLIEPLITKKTRAIVSNDQWGHPCNKEAILALCEKYKLDYIEDCSHAHFAEYKNRYTGTFGAASCFSLQGRKLISGGEGGIILTDRQDIYEKAVLLGHNLKRPVQSVKDEEYRPPDRTGYGLKLRMHPLAALMIYYQLQNYVFEWIASRSETLTYFESRLEGTFLLPMAKRSYVTSMGAWYGFMLRLKPEYHVDKKHFLGWMNEHGLQVTIPKSAPIPNYALFHPDVFPIGNFQKYSINDCPIANQYYESILNFPTLTFHEYDLIEKYENTIRQYMRTFL